MRSLKRLGRVILHTTIIPKIATGILLWMGLPLSLVAKMTAVVAYVWAIWFVRKGIREQYWEPARDGYRRRWENLVWDHSVWVNPETPDSGVERLTRPWIPKQQKTTRSSSPSWTMRRRRILTRLGTLAASVVATATVLAHGLTGSTEGWSSSQTRRSDEPLGAANSPVQERSTRARSYQQALSTWRTDAAPNP